VGLLHRGKLIHCDTPDNLKRLVPAYAVRHEEPSLEDAFVFLVNQAEYTKPAEAPAQTPA
jgi:hypothetical protein